jgi:hypothetical protein
MLSTLWPDVAPKSYGPLVVLFEGYYFNAQRTVRNRKPSVRICTEFPIGPDRTCRFANGTPNEAAIDLGYMGPLVVVTRSRATLV